MYKIYAVCRYVCINNNIFIYIHIFINSKSTVTALLRPTQWFSWKGWVMLTSPGRKQNLQTRPSIASSLPSTSFPPSIGCRTSLPSPGCSTSRPRWGKRPSETSPPRQKQGATLDIGAPYGGKVASNSNLIHMKLVFFFPTSKILQPSLLGMMRVPKVAATGDHGDRMYMSGVNHQQSPPTSTKLLDIYCGVNKKYDKIWYIRYTVSRTSKPSAWFARGLQHVLPMWFQKSLWHDPSRDRYDRYFHFQGTSISSPHPGQVKLCFYLFVSDRHFCSR